MKKLSSKQKKGIWDIITGFLFALTIIPMVFLYVSMMDSVWTYVGKQTIETGLPIIKEYSMICLTLFGISLIGGIFSPRQSNGDPQSKRMDYAKRTLLFISLIFLLAFVFLQMTVVKTYALVGQPLDQIQSELNLARELYRGGLTFYILGLISLFWILIGFFIVRYTHIPEKYDKLKERFISKESSH